jgi:hypothetical protein
VDARGFGVRAPTRYARKGAPAGQANTGADGVAGRFRDGIIARCCGDGGGSWWRSRRISPLVVGQLSRPTQQTCSPSDAALPVPTLPSTGWSREQGMLPSPMGGRGSSRRRRLRMPDRRLYPDDAVGGYLGAWRDTYRPGHGGTRRDTAGHIPSGTLTGHSFQGGRPK